MTYKDKKYIEKKINKIEEPVLEMGSKIYEESESCRQIFNDRNIDYYGTDISDGEGVDYIADFEREECIDVFSGKKFGTILCLNVLEHTFLPVKILDNCVELTKKSGNIIVITPTIWPLHKYPIDTYRINPGFYVEYAERRKKVDIKELVYVDRGSVKKYLDGDGNPSYPPPSEGRFHRLWSRAIHKIANTFGRSMHSPSHLATAAVFRKEE